MISIIRMIKLCVDSIYKPLEMTFLNLVSTKVFFKQNGKKN